jgi:hypothetical protein
MKRAVKLAIIEALFFHLESAYDAACLAAEPEGVDGNEFDNYIRDLRSSVVESVEADPPTPEEIDEAARQDEEDDRIRDAWSEWENENGPLNYAIPSIPHGPDEIAFEGKCILFDTDDGTWGSGHTYVCVNLENPTWSKVMRAFDVSVAVTGDRRHCFLEGLEKVAPKNYARLLNMEVPEDVTVLRFATGS